MLIEIIIECAVEVIRTLLVEEVSDHVRSLVSKIRPGRELRGLDSVKRHIRRSCRQRLFNRLSTRGLKSWR